MADPRVAPRAVQRRDAGGAARRPAARRLPRKPEADQRTGRPVTGFVWRHQNADGNSTGTRVGDDPLLVINFAVWESIESLFEYTYHSDHVEVFRRRREWFQDHFGQHYLAMWWVAGGAHPDGRGGGGAVGAPEGARADAICLHDEAAVPGSRRRRPRRQPTERSRGQSSFGNFVCSALLSDSAGLRYVRLRAQLGTQRSRA